MSRLLVNGTHLNVEVAGSGQGIVALHGFTGDMSTWSGFTSEAARDFTVILVDLVGHGRSDAPGDPERYRTEQSVADVTTVLDRVGVGAACWVGYSMGGRIALLGAALAPQRCACLVLEGASPGLATAEERAQRLRADEALANYIEEKGVEAFIDYWERQPLFASQAQLARETRERLRSQRLRSSVRGLANTLRAAGPGAQPALQGQLPLLHIPVLCVVGEHDVKFMAIAEEMCHALPEAHLVVVVGAGHAVHLEQPDHFNRVVLEFVREHCP